MISGASVNLEHARSIQWPPMHREDRLRLLLVTIPTLGWKTYGDILEEKIRRRDDVDCVHLHLRPSIAQRILNRPIRVPGLFGAVRPVHPLQSWNLVISRWIAGALPLERFDAVHVAPQGGGLAFALRLANSRTVFSVAIDETIAQDARELRPRRLPRAVQQAERGIFSHASLITPMSHWAAESLRQDYQVSEERILVIPCSVTIPAQRDGLESTDRTGEPVRMVFIGNAFERKGGSRLLRWHQSRWWQRSELHVFSRQAKPRGILRNVTWHGAVNNDVLLNQLLPKMDLLVLPTFHDMSPWVVAEALSRGVPCVVSDVAAVAEHIQDGCNGYAVKPFDDTGFIRAVERLMDDAALRERMRRAARDTAASWLDASKNYDLLLDRLILLADVRRAPTTGSSDVTSSRRHDRSAE